FMEVTLMMTIRKGVLAMTLVPAVCGCSSVAADAVGERDDTERRASTAQEERWSTADDPALFGGPLERRLSALPRQGSASVTPWPGSYWPTYRDSINERWAGTNSPSPAEKYGAAFGVANVEDAVSRN